jgi:hypothetical protein
MVTIIGTGEPICCAVSCAGDTSKERSSPSPSSRPPSARPPGSPRTAPCC